MPKGKIFKDILGDSFRWPQKNDLPFSEAKNSGNNAKIADDDFTRLVLMIGGYKKAADLMVKRTALDWRERDFLVYPIIFNYRHFLELSLKYQLATYGPRVGVEPNWKTHKLEILWSEFQRVLRLYGIDDPDGTDSIVDRIVLNFANIDPGSFSHRYPVDQKGILLGVQQNELDLVNLADVMKAIEGYFNGCDGYLDEIATAL